MNIRIGEDDFRKLVAGQVIEFSPHDDGQPIRLALADIGWMKMLEIVGAAMYDESRKPPLETGP